MTRVEPIPVWLLSGFLGAGKTSLLLNWLRDPALRNAALVVNELGEVGFDAEWLGTVVDSAGLLSGRCVCCSGLEDLEDTLAGLFWDRLYRRRPRFDAVVIETTGMADPRTIQAALARHPLLRERYVLKATLIAFSCTQGASLLNTFKEAHAQITAADVVVLTKSDLADPRPLRAAVAHLNLDAACLTSAAADLAWTTVSQACDAKAGVRDVEAMPVQGHASHQHSHAVEADFLALPEELTESVLQRHLMTLMRPDVLRFKGVLQVQERGRVMVHWSWGDPAPTVLPSLGLPTQPLGLTWIHRLAG